MVRVARTIWLALALVNALASFARAQEPADATVSFHGLTFPASVAGWERSGVREFEKDNPGLGYSVVYRQPGALTTVYIYDLKARDIPDDPAAPEIKTEFQAAKADMIAAQRQGFYRKLEPKEQFAIADAHGRARLLCAAAVVARIDQPRDLATYLCVGGWNGKFIKFRMTGEQLPQTSVRQFLRAWTDLLWPT
jgi:hypothetical protein